MSPNFACQRSDECRRGLGGRSLPARDINLAFAAITLEPDLAARSIDGFILRLGYVIHLIGRITELSPFG
jgi:hypothetical protein